MKGEGEGKINTCQMPVDLGIGASEYLFYQSCLRVVNLQCSTIQPLHSQVKSKVNNEHMFTSSVVFQL